MAQPAAEGAAVSVKIKIKINSAEIDLRAAIEGKRLDPEKLPGAYKGKRRRRAVRERVTVECCGVRKTLPADKAEAWWVKHRAQNHRETA